MGKKKSSMYSNFEKVYKIQEFLPLTVQDQFPKFLKFEKKKQELRTAPVIVTEQQINSNHSHLIKATSIQVGLLIPEEYGRNID